MAYDITTKLKARQLAEAGLSLARVRAVILEEDGITIGKNTLDRWAQAGNWMTGQRAKAALAGSPVATLTIPRPTLTRTPQNIPQTTPIPGGQIMQPSCNKGANDAQMQTSGVKDGEIMGKSGDAGGVVGAPDLLPSSPPPETPHSEPSISPEFPLDGDHYQSETFVNQGGKVVPHSSPKCPPHLFLDAPKEASPDGAEMALRPGQPVPTGEPWPLIGQFQRPATIAEMLPQDFEGFRQTLLDGDQLAKVEAIRAAAYRENISATLLKLSQYAVQLADSDPRLALQVMDKIAKLDGVGGKRFRLDEAGGESKAGEQMRKVSQREEDGGGGVVVVVDPD